MPFQRLFSVRLLDVLVRGSFGDAQRFVVIFAHDVLLCRRSDRKERGERKNKINLEIGRQEQSASLPPSLLQEKPVGCDSGGSASVRADRQRGASGGSTQRDVHHLEAVGHRRGPPAISSATGSKLALNSHSFLSCIHGVKFSTADDSGSGVERTFMSLFVLLKATRCSSPGD